MALKYTYQDVSDFKKVVDKLQRRASTVELAIAEELYAIHRGGPIYLRKRGTDKTAWLLLFCTLQAEIMKVAANYADPTVDYSAVHYTTFPILLVPSRLLLHVPDLAFAPDYDTVFGDSGRANVRRFLKACNDALNLCHVTSTQAGTLTGSVFTGVMTQTEQDGSKGFKKGETVVFDKYDEPVHFLNEENAVLVVENKAAYSCTVTALFRYASNVGSCPVSNTIEWSPRRLGTRRLEDYEDGGYEFEVGKKKERSGAIFEPFIETKPGGHYAHFKVGTDTVSESKYADRRAEGTANDRVFYVHTENVGHLYKEYTHTDYTALSGSIVGGETSSGNSFYGSDSWMSSEELAQLEAEKQRFIDRNSDVRTVSEWSGPLNTAEWKSTSAFTKQIHEYKVAHGLPPKTVHDQGTDEDIRLWHVGTKEVPVPTKPTDATGAWSDPITFKYDSLDVSDFPDIVESIGPTATVVSFIGLRSVTITTDEVLVDDVFKTIPFTFSGQTYWYTRTLLPENEEDVYRVKGTIVDESSWPDPWYIDYAYRVKYSGELPSGKQPVSGWDGVFKAEDLLIRSDAGWYRVPAERNNFLRRQPSKSNDASRCFMRDGPPECRWDVKTDSSKDLPEPSYSAPVLDVYDKLYLKTTEDDGTVTKYEVELAGNTAYRRVNKCFVNMLKSADSSVSIGVYGAHAAREVDFRGFFNTPDAATSFEFPAGDAVTIATLNSAGDIIGYGDIKPVKAFSLAVCDYTCSVCLMYDYSFNDQ